MLGFAETFGAVLGSFLAPAFVALLIISLAAKYLNARYLAAFALGIYFWFFSDTIGDASLLGVDEGFTGGAFHFALWLLFGIGLLLIFTLDKDMFTAGPAGTSFGFAIPLLVALAVGIHGFGEGAAIGGTAAVTSSTNLLDAFGGVSAAIAFILHKGLEPMMVGAAYWVYAKGHAKSTPALIRDLLVLTLAFTLPGIAGGAIWYYLIQVFPGADATYIFAFGLGTSIYAAVRLARPLFEAKGGNRWESLRTGAFVLFGFTCLYVAALLHS